VWHVRRTERRINIGTKCPGDKSIGGEWSCRTVQASASWDFYCVLEATTGQRNSCHRREGGVDLSHEAYETWGALW